jgi:hypothetical protein
MGAADGSTDRGSADSVGRSERTHRALKRRKAKPGLSDEADTADSSMNDAVNAA